MHMTSRLGGLLLLAVAVMNFPASAMADPCGLVPPLVQAGADAGNQARITRIGKQRTYVFFRNGVESIALRPGFSGKVDEFGMLIPFPSPPAIRKLPDNVFEQIAAAIDPPEVVIDLRPPSGDGGFFGGGGGLGGGGGFGGAMGFVPRNQVRVIREEAVGMYEVAVLAAGSATSLKRWMDDHQYSYPSGMDAVCPEYIEQRWCFVAVKTKVNQKAAADPRPGQRRIDNELPEGASFDGHVQAMGFRFRTRQLVVPMRLSVHNSGKLHNVVYLLSDTPCKIRHLPETFVKRQVSGEKLFDQLTQPLPLRIIGGTIDDIPLSRRRGLAVERDPRPHNGVAAELFAADIVAARTGRLESRSESFEKELEKINAALDLRGADVDRDVQQLLSTERAMLIRATLRAIEGMTLTVIDGDFPRDVLARENLTFSEYHMPLEKSDREHYDANAPFGQSRVSPGSLPGWLGLALVGVAVWFLPRQNARAKRGRTLLLLLALPLAGGGQAAETPSLSVLVRRLGNPEYAARTADQICSLGQDAVPALIKQSQSRDILKQGWAIVCLARLGGADAMSQLNRIQSHKTTPPLVKSWVSAALVKAALVGGGWEGLADQLARQPTLSRSVILAAGPQPLIRIMLEADNQTARRQAAGYVAAMPESPQQTAIVATEVVRAVKFVPASAESPWHGGPLFIPGIRWAPDDAVALIDDLIRWRLWADERGDTATRRQIDNNLRNIGLIHAARFQPPPSDASIDWLRAWKRVIGDEPLRALLAEQHVEGKYADLLAE